MHDLAHEPQLVRHVNAHAGAYLYFLLAAHNLSVGAGHGQASHQTLKHQRIRVSAPI